MYGKPVASIFAHAFQFGPGVHVLASEATFTRSEIVRGRHVPLTLHQSKNFHLSGVLASHHHTTPLEHFPIVLHSPSTGPFIQVQKLFVAEDRQLFHDGFLH